MLTRYLMDDIKQLTNIRSIWIGSDQDHKDDTIYTFYANTSSNKDGTVLI